MVSVSIVQASVCVYPIQRKLAGLLPLFMTMCGVFVFCVATSPPTRQAGHGVSGVLLFYPAESPYMASR